jgi:hypothetical protein
VDAERATLLGHAGPTCPVGATLGPVACPGCGLTRSTALILQGDWSTAFAVHPGGWIIVLLCSAGALIHGDILRRGSASRRHRRLLRAGRWVLLLGLAGSWLWRMCVTG